MTFPDCSDIITKLISRKRSPANIYGGITQLVEYPVHTRFVICSSQIAATRPVGQAVKTPPFHGGNMGSIPVRVTKRDKSELFRKSKLVRICFLLYISRLRVPRRGHATSPFSFLACCSAFHWAISAFPFSDSQKAMISGSKHLAISIRRCAGISGICFSPRISQ